jgi:hypothetical protein
MSSWQKEFKCQNSLTKGQLDLNLEYKINKIKTTTPRSLGGKSCSS